MEPDIAVTLLDTLTGERLPMAPGGTAFWWSEGNGSCDCNRSLFMGIDLGGDVCHGNNRFLIVACSDPRYSLRRMNEGYPEELLTRHGIK